jgi:acetyl esterase/lipase
MLWACAGIALRLSLLVSPRPAALVIRKAFAKGGARTARRLEPHAPAGTVVLTDERYGDEPDMLLDVFRPAAAEGPLPLVVWVHGGGFVGGSKDELAAYFKLLASHGFVVAGPRYSLAPEHRYPTPLRQLMRALEFLQAHRERLQVDAGRIVLAGDSAGAHIAAQLAALATTPGYPEAVGVAPTIGPPQLRGVVLACGPFDLELARATHSRFVQVVLWSYSGVRGFLDDPAFGYWSIPQHVTPSFPPALITVGNADPLRGHSESLASALRAKGVETETLFFPDDHDPPLGHEYQFDLDSDSGQQFLERELDFLRRRLVD